MSLKSALLNPKKSVKEVEILGTNVFIRRLSAGELLDYDEAVQAAFKKSAARTISTLGVNLILSSITDKNGNKLKKSELPSEDELLSVHDNKTLIDALSTIQRHSAGTLEEAEKN